MKTAAEHARAFPNCRSRTLVHLIQKERTTAALTAYVERKVDEQIVACLRTFPVNVWRSMRKAG